MGFFQILHEEYIQKQEIVVMEIHEWKLKAKISSKKGNVVSSSFSLLSVVRRLWLLRTSFSGKTGLGVRWLIQKIAFFTIFDPTWTHIFGPNRHKHGFLQCREILIFNPLERQKLYQLCTLGLTNCSKNIQNNFFFAIFDL